MTAQEIDRIEKAIRHIQSSLDVDQWACEIAVEAMRKQIPKGPIISSPISECVRWIELIMTEIMSQQTVDL